MAEPLNPLPLGPAFIDSAGRPTQEFYWFLLTLFTVTQSSAETANIPFTPVVPAAGSDPFVQALEKQSAFNGASAASVAAAVQQQFAALLRQLAFSRQTNNALDRINALERSLAFRPQPPASGSSGIQIVVYLRAAYATAYAAGLGGAPLFIFVSDYAHLIYWNGTIAIFADGGNNYISAFENDPPGPGWQLMDGSITDFLNADGTVNAITVEDLTSSAGRASYLKLGSPNSGPNVSVAPTISGTTDLFTVGFTPAAAAAAATAGAGSVRDGTGASIGVLTPPFSGGGGGGGGHLNNDPHSHTLSGAAIITATGEPQSLERRPFFRR